MEIVAGALPSLIPKLFDLLVGEYNLQKEVKGGIIYLQSELESMQGALVKISKTPAELLDDQDKIWSKNVRELSYDIEDNIDAFMVQCKAKQDASKTIIYRSLELLMQPKIRHNMAIDIGDLKCRVEEVARRRERYRINNDVAKPVIVDPRLLAQYEKAEELVGIDEAREEVIKILMDGNQVSKQKDVIVSIVGFGGLGKTTLANAVYEKLKAEFDCSAFVSVSHTPNTEKLLMDMLSQLRKKHTRRTNATNQLREFLKLKRYFIVIDDIWNTTVWKTIKCALPDNNLGSTIITTTRIFHVAEQVGGVYKLEPLSLSNSRKLLYRRIFHNDSIVNNKDTKKCPDEQLEEVSERILTKCAGVPLAILTMASLLACKPKSKIEWYKVYNSVGTGLEKDEALENMRKILSFSYFDLPYHLRTCLLYLTMFPEDYKISKNRLIWMWIAEGFVQSKDQQKSLFEHAESYFNELINRSMLQPIHNPYTGSIEQCRVHDMLLDLIRSLATEENFVTILNDTDGTFPSNMSRRLSLQNGKVDRATTEVTRSLKQVRSVVVFPSGIDLMPGIGRFGVLRVLDLQYCSISQGDRLKYLGNLLVHLKYLGLRHTDIAQLPQEIGKLQNLQTLDVTQNEISLLPSTVVQLRNLMCLLADKWTIMPKGIGNLTCLEDLSALCIDKSTMDNVQELGQLMQLRVLHLVLPKWNDKLLECLHKLKKIQNLCIEVTSGVRSMGGLDAWVAPRHIWALRTRRSCWFSRLPAWMNPCRVLNLSVLSIAMAELHTDDLEMLRRLPALRYLDLEVKNNENFGDHGSLVFGDGWFPCLVRGEFWGFVWPVVFRTGAMPRLQELFFRHSYVRMGRGSASSRIGPGKLPSLQHITIEFVSGHDSTEAAEQAKAAVHHAAKRHPNRPTLRV